MPELEQTSPQDVERLEHYFQSFGVNTMTLGEKWRQEGLEKGLQKGIEKGREEGINIGLEKGIEKGREEGINIGMEKGHQEVARNMLQLGLDLNLIQKATGLALELLQKMRQNMNSSPQT